MEERAQDVESPGSEEAEEPEVGRVKRVSIDPGLDSDYAFSNVGEHRSTTKAVWQMHGVSAKVSLTLLVAGSAIGTIAVVACWVAYLFDARDRFAPGSISEMVHRKDSEENDIFMLFGLAGLLILGSHFSLRLSNCVIPDHVRFGPVLNSFRFLGTALGAAMVAFVPTKASGEFGVGVGVHMASAILLFASGLIPEGWLLWHDHPIVGQPDHAPNRRARIVLLVFSSACSVGYFVVEGYKMASAGSSVGPCNSTLHTTTFLLEVYVGIALLMLHMVYWHSAPERDVTVVPKTQLVLRGYFAFMLAVFIALSGVHVKKVMSQSMRMATARYLCDTEAAYTCRKCKNGVAFDEHGECTIISNDEVYWTETLMPQLAVVLDKDGADPNEVITHTTDKEKALGAKWLKYHVCRTEGVGSVNNTLEVYTGFMVPDVARLDLDTLGLNHLTEEHSPLGERQRLAMTVACRDPVTDWKSFLSQDADSQKLNGTISDLRFQCLSFVMDSYDYDGLQMSERQQKNRQMARSLWITFMIENGRLTPGQAERKLDDLVPREMQSIEFRTIAVSHASRFVDPGPDVTNKLETALTSNVIASTPRGEREVKPLTLPVDKKVHIYNQALCSFKNGPATHILVSDLTGDHEAEAEASVRRKRVESPRKRKKSLPGKSFAQVNSVLAAGAPARKATPTARTRPFSEDDEDEAQLAVVDAGGWKGLQAGHESSPDTHFAGHASEVPEVQQPTIAEARRVS